MSARLVLNEFDVNLAPFAPGLVVVVVVVVSSSSADTRTLDAAIFCTLAAIAGRQRVISTGWRVVVKRFSDFTHRG